MGANTIDGIGRPGARRAKPVIPGDEIVQFTILIPAAMAQRIEAMAHKADRTRVAEIRVALREHIAKHDVAPKAKATTKAAK